MHIEPGRAEMERILKALANPANLEILMLLSLRPSYTREIARLLGRDETDVSRRLKTLERLGLVRGVWRRVEERNIRVYELTFSRIKIEPSSGGIILEKTGGGGEERIIVEADPVVVRGIPVPRVFVGRGVEVETLRSLDYRICMVWGIGGIGKTSLVATALSPYTNVFWHDFSEIDTLDYLLWRLAFYLASLGEKGMLDALKMAAPIPGIINVALGLLSKTGSIIVLDNYHKVEQGAIGELVRTYMASSTDGYKLIIISRTRPRGIPLHEEGVCEIPLRGLDKSEVEELVEKIRGEPPDRGYLERLYNSTGGHPLLLILAIRRGLDKALDYLWSDVLSSLSEGELRVLSDLAVFDEPLDLETISQVLGLRDPLPVVSKLCNKGFIERSMGMYRVHDSIRSLIPTPAKARLYLRAARILEERGWRERIKAMKYYLKAGRPEEAARIVARRLKVDDYNVWPHARSYLEVLRELHSSLRDSSLLPYVLIDRARFEYRLGGDTTYSLALVEDAIRLAEDLGDTEALAIGLVEQAFLLDDAGRTMDALNAIERAYRIVEKLNEQRLLYLVYVNKVKILASLGRMEEALEYTRRELDMARRIGDEFYIIMSMTHLSNLLAQTGEVEEAIRTLEKALKASKELGLDILYFAIHLTLMEAYSEAGDREKLSEAIQEYEKTFKPLTGFRSLDIEYYKARILELEGRIKEALNHSLKMLNECKRTGYHILEPRFNLLTARLYLTLGETGEARKHLAQACKTHGYARASILRKAQQLAKEHNLNIKECQNQ